MPDAIHPETKADITVAADVLNVEGDDPSSEPTSAPTPSEELHPEDFYYEGPYLVFTAAYHLRRGYCCNSDCRHCPYKDSD